MLKRRAYPLLLLLPPALGAAAPPLDDPCAQFSWDVRHERALFASAPHSLSSGSAAGEAPALKAEQLYELVLHPQADVHFALAPERVRPMADPHAGLASLTLDTAGRYRIALDQPLWVDVLSSGAALRAEDFQGRPGCTAPHKIVEFTLPAHQLLLLQFSGGSAARLRLTVTHAPAP
jgi:hypothetical protein